MVRLNQAGVVQWRFGLCQPELPSLAQLSLSSAFHEIIGLDFQTRSASQSGRTTVIVQYPIQTGNFIAPEFQRFTSHSNITLPYADPGVVEDATEGEADSNYPEESHFEDALYAWQAAQREAENSPVDKASFFQGAPWY
ncbi:hypothetical protein GGTG_09350 [Gaeumannomyces tritici R3-111a-1]|uniref:Uncharacterized protein n=1 Tax=Gaeumannomyces tritici (strain R3-111a-1) TaxID=644352 RepID=J3P753_GAET3|nr:hypothetical protein GGTG_09350 [Gaeumannomyces tritici R3-111a-1]EJT72484.1 hypothetical protein GGTG_09350 [Gaeumannomyces tritici R3-111a-1]